MSFGAAISTKDTKEGIDAKNVSTEDLFTAMFFLEKMVFEQSVYVILKREFGNILFPLSGLMMLSPKSIP